MSARKQFEVITLDVWGNEEEGFEVNDLHRTGDFITITDEATDADVVAYLRQIDYLSEYGASVAQVEWCDDTLILIDNKETGAPIFQLITKEGF